MIVWQCVRCDTKVQALPNTDLEEAAGYGDQLGCLVVNNGDMDDDTPCGGLMQIVRVPNNLLRDRAAKQLRSHVAAELPESEALMQIAISVQEALNAIQHLQGLPEYSFVAEIIELQRTKLMETQMWMGQLLLRMLPGVEQATLAGLVTGLRQ